MSNINQKIATTSHEPPRVVLTVAKLLRASRQLIGSGGRRIGRHVRFHRDALLNWLAGDDLHPEAGPPSTTEPATPLAFPAGGTDEPPEAWEGWNPDEVERVKQLRQWETSGELPLSIKAELRVMNRLLRKHFGARKRVILDIDFYGKHGICWYDLSGKARDAIRSAISETCGGEWDSRWDRMRWWDLNDAIPVLRAMNERLSDPSRKGSASSDGQPAIRGGH